jgi:hypothetical protein
VYLYCKHIANTMPLLSVHGVYISELEIFFEL